MINLEISENGEQKYLDCSMERGEADTFVLEMVRNNEIPGLVKANFSLVDDTLNIKYDLQSLGNVEEMFNSVNNIDIYIGMLKGVAKALISLNNYMLDAGCLLFDTNYMYWNYETKEAVMIALPIEASMVNLCDFLKSALLRYDFGSDARSMEVLGKLLTFFKSNENLDGEKIQTFLLGINTKNNVAEGAKNIAGQAYIMQLSTGKKVFLKAEKFTVGRRDDLCDFAVPSAKKMSKIHATIIHDGNCYYIQDEGSLNHTYVNESEIKPGEYKILADGDTIRFASEKFGFGYDASVSAEHISGSAVVVSKEEKKKPITAVDSVEEDVVVQEDVADIQPIYEEQEELIPVSPEERITLYDLLSRYNPERAAEYKRQKAIDKAIKEREKGAKKAKTRNTSASTKSITAQNEYAIPGKKK